MVHSGPRLVPRTRIPLAVTLLRAPALDPPTEVESQPPFGAEPLPLPGPPSPPPARTPPAGQGAAPLRFSRDLKRTAAVTYLVERELRVNGLSPTQLARPQPERRLLTTAAPVPDAPVSAWSALRLYVGMCVEVLNGYRPVAQLRPMSDPQRFTDITDQLVRRTTRVRMSPSQAARQGRLVRVRRMLVCEPLSGIAEAAVVLEQGDTCWSMAVRMERNPDPTKPQGWRCVLVQVI